MKDLSIDPARIYIFRLPSKSASLAAAAPCPVLRLCLMAFPSVSSSKSCPRTCGDLGPLTVRPPPSTRENRFARPSPFVFARAVTGVVCNPTTGREKRFCRRTVSSIRGGEDVERGVDTGATRDGAPESFGRNILGCRDECGPSMDSSVCAEKWEVLGLGVTCKVSSWKFSRT